MRLTKIAFSLIVISMQAGAQDGSPCREFVQKFLDWYVPLAWKTRSEPPFDAAIRSKPELFSAELLKEFKIDAEARAKVTDDIVGLDFDPFLYTQDLSNRYVARGVELKDKTCLVEVAPASAKGRSAKQAVVAEVHLEGVSWKFVNFRYPGDKTNLLDVLAQLRRERGKDHD